METSQLTMGLALIYDILGKCPTPDAFHVAEKGRSALTAQLEGWTDRFDFDPSGCPAARYAREGGAHYEF